MQVGRVEYLVRFFADLADLLLGVRFDLGKGLRDIVLALFLIRRSCSFLSEGHDLVVGLEIDLIKDALVEQLLVVGPCALSRWHLVLHLKRARSNLAWNEAVSLGLGLLIFFVL